MAVRPHRHAPRWRSHALPARVAPMLIAIPSSAFTSHRFRVIGTGPAVGAAPPRTISHVRSLASPFRLNKAARRPAALLFVPHRDPLRLLPPRAAPDASGFALAGGGDRCRAGLRPYKPASVPTREAFPPVPGHQIANSTPSHAPRPRARRFAPAARRHVARRRACHGASFAPRVRSPSVGRWGHRPRSERPPHRPPRRGFQMGKTAYERSRFAALQRSKRASIIRSNASSHCEGVTVLLSLLRCERWPAAKNKL